MITKKYSSCASDLRSPLFLLSCKNIHVIYDTFKSSVLVSDIIQKHITEKVTNEKDLMYYTLYKIM